MRQSKKKKKMQCSAKHQAESSRG